tara:strand:+ start:922 stop:1581 length:660 start_codon:yes stop_codon:yes gene_type:complete
MAPKKRIAKKKVVQQKQKQSQNVSQRVTVNLVPAKARPRKRAIANSNYKAYQQSPQTIFLNNPAPPPFPTTQSSGFSPYKQPQPLGVPIMDQPSQFNIPERIEAPAPVREPIERNPLRDSSIFGEEQSIITQSQTPVSDSDTSIDDTTPFERPQPQTPEVGRRMLSPSINKMKKGDLIRLAIKYDLPTTRIGAKGRPTLLSKDDLKSSIGIYLSNRLTL